MEITGRKNDMSSKTRTQPKTAKASGGWYNGPHECLCCEQDALPGKHVCRNHMDLISPNRSRGAERTGRKDTRPVRTATHVTADTAVALERTGRGAVTYTTDVTADVLDAAADTLADGIDLLTFNSSGKASCNTARRPAGHKSSRSKTNGALLNSISKSAASSAQMMDDNQRGARAGDHYTGRKGTAARYDANVCELKRKIDEEYPEWVVEKKEPRRPYYSRDRRLSRDNTDAVRRSGDYYSSDSSPYSSDDDDGCGCGDAGYSRCRCLHNLPRDSSCHNDSLAGTGFQYTCHRCSSSVYERSSCQSCKADVPSHFMEQYRSQRDRPTDGETTFVSKLGNALDDITSF